MRVNPRYLLAAALLAVPLRAGVTGDGRTALVIRLYNAANIPASELAVGRGTAESILGNAGLALNIRQCGACAESLQRREIVVRIVPAPTFNTTLPSEAFGVAYVIKQTDRGWLATVFSDRIDAAASRAGIDPGMLLGFVMAHEVGHLLLGVDYHGDSGIMRAEWPDAVLDRREAWQFSSIEAARIRQAVSTPF